MCLLLQKAKSSHQNKQAGPALRAGRQPKRIDPRRAYRADWRTVRLAKDLKARVYWLTDTPHQRIMPSLDRFARAGWRAADIQRELDRMLAARGWEVPSSRVSTTTPGKEHRYPLRCPWGYLAMLLRTLEPTDLQARARIRPRHARRPTRVRAATPHRSRVRPRRTGRRRAVTGQGHPGLPAVPTSRQRLMIRGSQPAHAEPRRHDLAVRSHPGLVADQSVCRRPESPTIALTLSTPGPWVEAWLSAPPFAIYLAATCTDRSTATCTLGVKGRGLQRLPP